MDGVKVAFLVLNYNTYEKTKKCVYSCITQKNVDKAVFVVDNSSNDGSLEKLKKEFGTTVAYLEFDKNYGYAGGNNRAIEYVTSMGYEYSFILNSDTELIGDRLCEKLLYGFTITDRCAIVAPKIYNVTSKGLVLNANKSKYLDLLIAAGIIPYKKKSFDNFKTIPEAQGSALLVNNEIFNRVGGFPEDYFMYNEESTLAKKVLWEGYIILWNESDGFFVKHHHDKSGTVDPWRIYLMGRNKAIEFYRYKIKSPIRWFIIYRIFLFYCKKKNVFNDYRSYKRGADNGRKLAKENASKEALINDAKIQLFESEEINEFKKKKNSSF